MSSKRRLYRLEQEARDRALMRAAERFAAWADVDVDDLLQVAAGQIERLRTMSPSEQAAYVRHAREQAARYGMPWEG